MKSVDEALQPRFSRLGQSGTSNRNEYSKSTAAKTSENIRIDTNDHLKKMEEKYLALKYPSFPTNFVTTDSSHKDLLKTHQVEFGTISGWDWNTGVPQPTDLYEAIKPFCQEEIRRHVETLRSQILEQVKGMLGIVIQSSLDDVYKDIGRVTDNLSSRLASLKKCSGQHRSKIDQVEKSLATTSDSYETQAEKIKRLEERQAKISKELRNFNLKYDSHTQNVDTDDQELKDGLRELCQMPRPTKICGKKNQALKPQNQSLD